MFYTLIRPQFDNMHFSSFLLLIQHNLLSPCYLVSALRAEKNNDGNNNVILLLYYIIMIIYIYYNKC